MPAEVLDTFFPSFFTSIAGHQITGSGSHDNACVDPPLVEEGLGCGFLQGLNPHQSMGQDRTCSSMLREVADIAATPLSIIFEKPQRLGDTLGDWKRVNVISIYKKGPKEHPGSNRPISLTSVPEKVMEASS